MEAASGSPAPLLCWCVLPARGQWIRRLSLPPGEPSSCRACRVGWGGLISSLVGALKSRDESMCGRSQPLPAASGLAHTPACPRGPRGSGPGHIGSGRLSGASRVEGPWPWGRLGGRGQGGVLRPQNSERGSASWWQMCCARAAVGTRGLSCVSVSCAGTRTHHVALSPGHGVHLVDVVGTRGAAAAWLLLSRLTFSSSSWVHGQRGPAARGEQAFQVDRRLSGLLAWMGIREPPLAAVPCSACAVCSGPACAPRPGLVGVGGQLLVLRPPVGRNLQHELLGLLWG